MPTPGKPVLNPFSGPDQAPSSVSVQGLTKPEISTGKIKFPRGISRVGTEDRLKKLDFTAATGLSVLMHIGGPFLLGAISLLILLLLSWLLHFNFWDLFKTKAPLKDMEFTLVRDTHAERPDKPLFKGNFNQKAGGKKDPNQPLKAIEQEPQSSPAKKASPPPQKPQQQVQQQAQPVTPKPVEQPKPKATSKPVATPTLPNKKAEEATDSTKQKKTETSQNTANQANPSANDNSQIASMGNSSAGAGSGMTAMGNSQGGDSQAGVDVAQDVDFGPFMADLERRIKRNWVPPRGSESRKVILVFYLARDGKVVKIETRKSSGDKEADEAAARSVEASAPFMAFPPQVSEDILPVEFTFDYNVLNPKNSKQALKNR